MVRAISAAFGSAIAVASPALAQTFPFFMGGNKEVPPTPSKAVGFADLELDVAAGTIHLFVLVDGIDVQDITGFHIHQAPAGANGPVVVDLLGLATFKPEPFVPLLSSFEANGIGLSPALVGELILGNLYLNLHTSAFPAGEIRGQAVPAPAGPAVVAGLVALAARRRR